MQILTDNQRHALSYAIQRQVVTPYNDDLAAIIGIGREEDNSATHKEQAFLNIQRVASVVGIERSPGLRLPAAVTPDPHIGHQDSAHRGTQTESEELNDD